MMSQRCILEADYEDDLRKTGFSKEGRHKSPQIILGLLVSIDGYPLAYCIHEGNKYEGHTMPSGGYGVCAQILSLTTSSWWLTPVL